MIPPTPTPPSRPPSREWTIEPSQDDVDAGAVAFEAVNEGEEPHELVVVSGVATADLPRDDGTIEAHLAEGMVTTFTVG